MAKFKVLKKYHDKELGLLQVGDEVEMTVKRSDEVGNTLKSQGYEQSFLERIEEVDKEEVKDKKETKEETKDKGE